MKAIWRRSLLIFLIAIFPLVISCGDKLVSNNFRNTDYVASESFEYAIEAAEHSGIVLDGVNCEVTLNCLPGLETVFITGVRKVGSDSYADAEEYLALLTVDVNDANDMIEISAEQPSDTEWRSFNVEFDINIPRDFYIDIEIVNGSVELDTLEAGVSINTVNGNIYFDRIIGECNLGVTNGQIRGATALPSNGSSSFSAVNGLIDVDIPQNTSALFDASVAIGSISVDDLVFHGYHETQTTFSGTLGSGDGEISISLVNGNISVRGF